MSSDAPVEAQAGALLALSGLAAAPFVVQLARRIAPGRGGKPRARSPSGESRRAK